MKKLTMLSLLIFLTLLTLVTTAQNVFADNYFISDIFSGDFFDAEKSPSNTEDDLMCWAASAANILAWTGWGNIYSSSEDTIFEYYQNHWTDEGGLPDYGWEWWFDGTNDSQGWDGWSQVDLAGGGFFPTEDFYNYYARSINETVAMGAIEELLKSEYGTSIGIYIEDTAGKIIGGHALTVWGYEFDTNGYLGLYVSDSDDDKYTEGADDDWDYYDVFFNTSSNQWYLSGAYSNWYIGNVYGLAKSPYETGPTVPEPATLALLGFGIAGIFLRKK